MAPRVPKGVHRDPHVRTVASPDYRFAALPAESEQQRPLLEDSADSRRSGGSPSEPRDPLLPTWYLFFISFFFFAAGASIVLIQGV